MSPPGLPIPPAAGTPSASFDRRLHSAVCAAYDLESLKRMLQLDMKVALLNEVEPGPFESVASDFIAWANRNGRLGEFLDRAVKDKSGRDALSAVRDEYVAKTAPPEGLPEDEVEAAVRRFAARFQERWVWFKYIKAYKELHRVLHDLGDYLGQVRTEAEARRAGGTPVSDTTAAALRGWAADAGRWWGQTEQADQLPLWVRQLDQATREFLGPNKDLHHQALTRLGSLPEASLLELNSEVRKCASRLLAGGVLADLETISRLIGREAPPRLAAVANAVEAFRGPCSRLAAAIRHDTLCQEIDTELRQARGMKARTPKAILGWDVIWNNLNLLRQERPGDPKAAAAGSAAAGFANARGKFDRLVEAFKVLFKAMDEALLSVTTDLLLAANELRDTLEDFR